MKHMETSSIEDQKRTQQTNKSQVEETMKSAKAQGPGSRIEVPCCCPGCFSFDF